MSNVTYLHITAEVEEALFKEGLAILDYERNRNVQIFRFREERYEFPSDRLLGTFPRNGRAVAQIEDVRRLSLEESKLQHVTL